MHVIMDEKIKARIPVELVGLPVGVKEEGGVLVHGLREIEVKCLPGDIPDKYVIDVAALKINESLHVSDLKIFDKVELLVSGSEMVATVSPPTKEEVVAPVAPTAEAAEAAAGAAAVAEADVKEKTAPGAAAPAKAASAKAAPAKAAPAAKQEKPSEKGKK
jgi:large subunit ribosomal protein L25